MRRARLAERGVETAVAGAVRHCPVEAVETVKVSRARSAGLTRIWSKVITLLVLGAAAGGWQLRAAQVQF